jgi:hypothetical protein
MTALYNFDAVKNRDAIDESLPIWDRYPSDMLSINADAKTSKGAKRGVLTGVLYEAPADIASRVSLCPMAKLAGCEDACLYRAGRGRFSNVQHARIRKTLFIDQHPLKAFELLCKNIEALVRKAERLGMTPAVRLNGTSDRDWNKWCKRHGLPNIFTKYFEVQFYDYSKVIGREYRFNHHVTLSYSHRPEYQRHAEKMLKSRAYNVAVAFHGKTLPATFKGREVINGDDTDVRFYDPENVVVGLTFKGSASNDTHGFAVSSLSTN